jgi:hypothetical protein
MTGEKTVIRTEKWVTITEAHPYHVYLTDERSRGGNAVVAEGYDGRCPLCRATRQPSAAATEP